MSVTIAVNKFTSVNSSIIHNGQEVKITHMSINYWIDKQNMCVCARARVCTCIYIYVYMHTYTVNIIQPWMGRKF